MSTPKLNHEDMQRVNKLMEQIALDGDSEPTLFVIVAEIRALRDKVTAPILKVTRSDEDGYWLHIHAPSGLRAGVALGHLKNSIAVRALNEAVASAQQKGTS